MARRECGREKCTARLARCRAVDLERARGPPLVRLVDCAVRGKQQPQALSMPWRSQRRAGAGGSLRAGLAGGRRASGRRGVAWGEGWGRCGVAVPLRARLCVTTISLPSSIPSNLSPSRPLRVTTTWRWERRDAKLSGAYAWATWAASGRLRRLRATASRWAPHGVGAPPEVCSAAPSQGLRSRGRRASCVTFDTLREACAKSLPSLMRPCADLPPPAAAECLLASPPTVRRAGDASGVWR